MDLKNVSDLLRQHYEKIILTLALIGLAAAVLLLMKFSEDEKEKINTYVIKVRRAQGGLIKPVDLTNLVRAVEMAKAPPDLDLSGRHNLVNPVKWQRKPDGTIIKNEKGTEGTLDQLQITRITPLMFALAFEGWAGSGYSIVTTNEAIPQLRRGFRQTYALNDTNRAVLVLRGVRGAPDNPSEVIVELKETGEQIAIAKDRPLIRTNTYEVDFRYDLENRNLLRQRINSVLKLGGEDYKIVAINPPEVVVSAANDKKYTLRQQAAAQ
jgi:hypothetical protein